MLISFWHKTYYKLYNDGSGANFFALLSIVIQTFHGNQVALINKR